jgi:LysR family cys regulon transcriptional activator
VALEGIDSDVIMTYVRAGMGAGIVTELAAQGDALGPSLVARPLGHLFGPNTTRVAFKRGAYLRQFVFAFAELLSERLSAPLIQRAMSGEADAGDYVL